MYKSKLQEHCQRMFWKLPEYRAEREGPDHNPRFIATVTVNGLSFRNNTPCKSSKEAQNDAAMLAFEHFTRSDITSPTTAVATSNSTPTPNPNPNPGPFNATTHFISGGHLPPQMQPSPAANGFAWVPKMDIGVSGPFNATTHVISRGHLTPQMQPSPAANGFARVPKRDIGFSAFSSASSGQGSVFATRGVSEPMAQPMHPVQQADGNISREKSGTRTAGIQHLYKNQLQTYAQKRNLNLPVYSHERAGPPHASIFKCKITIDGKTYESQDFSSTLKEAEHAAAKVALMSLVPDGLQEDDLGLYKNVLQELAQREGFSIPFYRTSKFGEAHIPLFSSTVEIEGVTFTGEKAKTKKQAEMNAAKVAYFTLKDRKPSKSLRILPVVQQGPKAHELPSHVPRSDVTAEPRLVLSPESSPIPNPIVVSSGQAEPSRENAEVCSQHSDILSPEPYNARNASSSSDDVINARQQDSLPSASCSKHGLPSSSPLSECFDNLIISCSDESLAETNTHSKKVIVVPRSSNMATPSGCTVLPISDDDWVAMELRSNQVRDNL